MSSPLKVSRRFAVGAVVISGMLWLAGSSTQAQAGARDVRASDHVLQFDKAPPAAPQAKFFTINGVLAKLDAANRSATPNGASSGDVELAALTPSDVATDAPSIQIAPVNGPEPFGLFAFRAPEGALWRKWRSVEADMARDADNLHRCQDTAAKAKTGRAQLENINQGVNLAIRYVSDRMQHGVADRWSSALSSFATGQGDCEDYAIAKYAALSEAGFAAEDLRLVLVRDRTVREDHAVLAVRHDGKWLIMDNRSALLREDSEISSFTPLFAINHRGVQLFATPYASRDANGGETDALPATDATGAAEWTGAEADASPAGGAIGEQPVLM
jgi:predicted transglutaminase-like cysteine proteinase